MEVETYQGLRDWLNRVEELGELKRLDHAHWDLEMGAAQDLLKDRTVPPALLFDSIESYPPGYRVLVNSLGSFKRSALTLGLPSDMSYMDFVKRVRERWKEIKPILPVFVKTGPVMENVQTGKEVNLYKFPAPRWFPEDGGRYIGTGSVTITRDPDEGWVNLGLYRIMIHDANTLSFYISPGKHGRIHRDKCFAQGKPCRVAISFGHDPLYTAIGSIEIPWGESEYNWIGGIKGRPVEVIQGEFTGLPFPADAEIVVEGESYPDDLIVEGPFGEWTGYYASSSRPEPVIRVKRIMHRNDPILLGLPLVRHYGASPTFREFLRSALVWDSLEKAGVPDVKGVWYHVAGGRSFILIISIKQRYPGHSRQAALVASQCGPAAYMGRYVIVVDEDIDITNTNELLWALASRSDPERSIEIIRRCRSGPLDPPIPKEQKGHNSKAIIDACRPWEWLDEFPRVVRVEEEATKRALKKWGKDLEVS